MRAVSGTSSSAAAAAAVRAAAAAQRLAVSGFTPFTIGRGRTTPASLHNNNSNCKFSCRYTNHKDNDNRTVRGASTPVKPATAGAALSFFSAKAAALPAALSAASWSLLPQQPHPLLLRAYLSSSSRSSSSAATAAAPPASVPAAGAMHADPGLLVTKIAPDFTTDAVLPNGQLGKVSLADYRKQGKGVVLLFYPLDFTFVCPSELLAFHHAAADFDQLGFQVLGVSVDSVYTHLAWTRTSPADGGVGRLSFPLLSDLKRDISSSFHVLLPEAGVALRGLFIIDKRGAIKHSTVNDLPLGRSVEEALRVCDMVFTLEQQKTAAAAAGESGASLLQQVCPANWRRGQKMMRATYEGVKEYLSEKEKEIKKKVV